MPLVKFQYSNNLVDPQVCRIIYCVTKILADPSKISPLYNEIKVGKSLDITCKGVNISWTFSGKHKLRGVYYKNNHIFVNKTTIKHQGHYICHGNDENQDKFIGVAQVSVLSKYQLYEHYS